MKRVIILILLTVIFVAGCTGQTNVSTNQVKEQTASCQEKWIFQGNFLGEDDYMRDCKTYCSDGHNTDSYMLVFDDEAEGVRYNTCYCEINNCKPGGRAVTMDVMGPNCYKQTVGRIYLSSWNLRSNGDLVLDVGNGWSVKAEIKKISADVYDPDNIALPSYENDIDDFTLDSGETHSVSLNFADIVDPSSEEFAIIVAIDYEVIESGVSLKETAILKGNLNVGCVV